MAESSSAVVEREWYTALYEEDCRQLLELLRERESLWSKGWKSDPTRFVTGRPRNYWRREKTRKWKGRTALHVAARRGCVELIERVVTLCKDHSGIDDRENRDSVSLPRESTDIESTDTECPVGSEERPVTPVPREDTELGEEESALSLEKFLLRKDEIYKLDAFAMALVNGNPDVLRTLLEVSHGCPALSDQYHITCHNYLSSAQVVDHRLRLREITVAAIDEARSNSESLLQEVVVERYNRHRDFNFLPIQEYLFHFLFTRCRAQELQILTRSQVSLRNVDKLYDGLRKRMMEKEKQDETTEKFRCFLWKLQDGQGRRPLHVSLDEDSIIRAVDLLKETMSGDNLGSILTARDGGGRTAWHRGAALGKILLFESPLFLHKPYKRFMSTMTWSMMRPQKSPSSLSKINMDGVEHTIDVNAVSSFNGFFRDLRKRTIHEGNVWTSEARLMHKTMPLHSAILFKQSSWIGKLAETLESIRHEQMLSWTRRREILGPLLHGYYRNLLGRPIRLAASNMIDSELWRTRRRAFATDFEDRKKPRVVLDSVGLAAMVGDVPVLSAVLEIQRTLNAYGAARKRILEGCNLLQALPRTLMHSVLSVIYFIYNWAIGYTSDDLLPAVHAAAASGKYGLLKMFIDDPLFDPFVVDSTGNTALHCAAKGLPVQFCYHLMDFVSCEQTLKSEKGRSKDSDDRSARQKCDNKKFLVEREGCINQLLQVGCDIWEMNTDGEAPYPSSDADPKFFSMWYEKQAKEFAKKQKYLNFAANAVSVTGALVATRSFSGPLQPSSAVASELRKGNVWMQTFIICNTMSFYLAIVAIILSLVPTFRMPQQSMTEELRRTRRVVTLAVNILFPSIIFALIAFGAAFFVITESHPISIGTAIAGAIMGFLAFFLFFVRVLAFSFRKSKIIKKLYNITAL